MALLRRFKLVLTIASIMQAGPGLFPGHAVEPTQNLRPALAGLAKQLTTTDAGIAEQQHLLVMMRV